MRDIRSDLQERATLIDVQIRAAYSHFEKTVEQLKNEHNVRVADLKSGLTMIAKFVEFEQRYFRPDSPQFTGRILPQFNRPRWLHLRTFSCTGSMRAGRCRERSL